MLISLTLLSISCQTSPKVEPYTLDIEFPVFPDPTDRASMFEAGIQFKPAGSEYIYESKVPVVIMPLDYWLLITEYKIEVDTAERLYRAGK